jgi:CHAT domain-containing protein
VQGIVARMRGDLAGALDYTTEALAVAQAIGDVDAEARAHNDFGRIAFELQHDPDAARAAYERALALAPRVQDRQIVARILNNLGNLARAASDARAAVDYYTRSGAEAKKAGDAYGVITAEHNIGLVYSQQNDPRRALVHLRRALKAEQALHSTASIARTLLSISEARRALGDDAGALAELARARDAAAKANDDVTLATILLREGDLQLARRNFVAADRAFVRSINLLTARGDERTLAAAMAYRAKLRLMQGRNSDAAIVALEAARRAADLGDDETVAHAQTIAGQAYRALRKPESAKTAFEAAIAAIERQREHAAGAEESRERQFEVKVLPYLEMVDLSAESNDAFTALDYAERAKARVLMDVLHAHVAQTLLSVQQVLPLDTDAIVEFAVGDNALHVFVVTRKGVQVFTTAIAREDVAAFAGRFARELSQRNLAFRRTAHDLWLLLLEPASAQLRGRKRICIIPDQELWRVPFHALIGPDDRYVGDDAAIFYAPSIAVLREIMRQPRRNDDSLLAVANASMPEALSEVTQLGALYGRRAHVEIGAREQSVKTEAPRYGILHFATHGVFDDDAPLSSHLVFAPGNGDDGRLHASEMLSLHLNAQLVVLSACETAAGRPAPGEGMIGMSWSLFVAGCPTMVASEWKVESASTTEMMVAFHRNVLVQHMTASEALRAAQLDVRQRYEHPFYWASFVVLGRGW